MELPTRAAAGSGVQTSISSQRAGCGYRLNRRWEWILPAAGHAITAREEDAILYLIEEWGFGGLND